MATSQTVTTDEAAFKGGSQLVSLMAKEQHIDANTYAATVMSSCFDLKNQDGSPRQPTREQFMAFLMIAREYGLNPITREIFAFEQRGKIIPIVSIDGWLNIINSHPEYNGMTFEDKMTDDGEIIAITCYMHRKDRDHATPITEYFEECKRGTEPWKKWPIRMLRHKATIQAARYAFGFAGIFDQDEAERMKETDIVGKAQVVPDEPQSAAKRIVSQVRGKGDKSEKPTQEYAQAPEQASIERAQDEAESKAVIDAEGEAEAEADELSPEAQAFVREMEAAEAADKEDK